MKWIWLCAVLLILNNLKKTNGEYVDLEKGLLFRERGEVLSSVDTWKIRIPMNVKIFTIALSDLKSNMDTFIQKLKRSGLETIADWVASQPEYSKIRVGSLMLKNMIDDIFSTIKHIITKRQIENADHLHFNWTDVVEINQKLLSHATNGNASEILNFMSEEVTIYNATNEQINLLKTGVYSQLQLVMENIQILQEIGPIPAGRSRQVRQLFSKIEAFFNEAMNSFRNAFEFLEAKITTLKQAYTLSALGKLDPFFLPMPILVKILNQIGPERGLFFPKDESGTTLRNFYNLAKVSVFRKADSSDLVLEVSFPVMDKKRNFTVFEPVPLPARLDEGLFYQINPEADLIAVDLERKRYFFMSFSEFNMCQNSANKVCYPKKLIHREDDEPSCLLRLLKNDDRDIDNLCNVVVMKTFKPRFIQPMDHSDFIYAVPPDTELETKCDNEARRSIEVPDSISGTGVLHVPGGCTVKSSGSTLIGTSRITTIGGVLDKIEIPKVSFPSVEFVSEQLANLSNWRRFNVGALFKVDLEKGKEFQMTIHKLRTEVERIEELPDAWYNPIKYAIENFFG
ncbi:Hypothetical predicted protein [Cloeon dipterum]|uniref:Vitellogenin domain-containing protein n=1 Tax=Cloeon dipterum TaxID=197152 RepID=A0A8S1DQM1_9INSE|nr:Hypothetical predicted protein [Cloeon dipterum]